MRRLPVPPRALTATAAATVAALLLLAPAPTAAQQPCGGTYTIRSGDTLAEIASRCGTTIPAILAANPGIRNNRDLEPEGRIRMPPAGMAPTPVEACGGFYTLQSGDTIEDVADRCGLTVPLLIAANPTLAHEQNVRVGGRVQIPDLPRPGAIMGPVVVTRGGDAEAIGALRAEDAPPQEAATEEDSAELEPLVRHEGILVQGERCSLLRTADGTEVGLAGELPSGFEMGERVAITGVAAPEDDCGTETTVEARILWRPRDG